jgi:hypothetical protein
MSGHSLRRQANLRRAFQHAIDVVAIDLPVIDCCRVVPDSQRMGLARSISAFDSADAREAVQAPLPSITRISKSMRVSTPGCWKWKALLRATARIGPEDHLPGEGLHAASRMHVEKQGVFTPPN